MSKNTKKTNPSPFKVNDWILETLKEDPYTVNQLERHQDASVTGIGDVYTPPTLVNFILDEIGYTADNSIDKVRIIDPCCGKGSFITEIVKRLRERLITMGYDPEDPDGARNIISTIKNNIVALDSKSNAVWGTSQLVLNELEQEISAIPRNNPVESLPVYQVNPLNTNIDVSSKRFHFVVGNPPYIKNKDIDPDDDNKYRESYKTAKGKYDIYPLYFERGINLLQPEGKIGFVTPDRFHRTEYGQPLREIIANSTKINLIVNLKDDPFPVVNAYPTITVATKIDVTFPRYQYDNVFDYCEVTSDNLTQLSKSHDHRSSSKYCSSYEQRDLEEGSWRFTSPEYLPVKRKLESLLPTLEELPIEISAGIATGADDIFILGEKDAKRIEKELIFPFIRGRMVRKGHLDDNLGYILNPYDHEGEPVRIKNYPEAYDYLSHYRSELKQRYCVRESGKNWYETHDTINTIRELERRIVTPDVSSKARFTITSDTICHNSCYSLHCKRDLKIFAAYLNSSISEFLLKASLPKLESGYWRQMKRDMVSLPVIEPREILPENANNLRSAYDEKDWETINQIFYDHLELDREDKKAISNYLD